MLTGKNNLHEYSIYKYCFEILSAGSKKNTGRHAPDSLDRQKERRKERKRRNIKEREISLTKIDTQVYLGQGSGVLDARNRRKRGRWCGVPIHRKG